MRCFACGSEEVKTIDHGPNWQAEGYGTRVHSVCAACDHGLCSGEC